jgi:hypothetical protein
MVVEPTITQPRVQINGLVPGNVAGAEPNTRCLQILEHRNVLFGQVEIIEEPPSSRTGM